MSDATVLSASGLSQATSPGGLVSAFRGREGGYAKGGPGHRPCRSLSPSQGHFQLPGPETEMSTWLPKGSRCQWPEPRSQVGSTSRLGAWGLCQQEAGLCPRARLTLALPRESLHGNEFADGIY